MNSDEGLLKIQKYIDKLSKGNQIDSLNIRSTNRKSMMSSIYLLATDEKDGTEFKKVTEFIPAKDLNFTETSKIAKDALHNHKVKLETLVKYIEDCKKLLPEGYSYVDIHGIRYAANPFGEKYYIILEIAIDKEYSPNEYVETFYDQTIPAGDKSFGTNNLVTYHTMTFVLEDGQLKMQKTNN